MTAIVETIEVDRPQAVVFDYATDPAKFAEWQDGVVGGHMDGDGPTTVGTRCITRRRIGFAERPVTAEVTEISPPNTWAVHGLDGPIRAQVDLKTEAISDARTRLTIAIDFEGHGIGKVLVPLVVTREARKEMPENLRRLKANLERSS